MPGDGAEDIEFRLKEVKEVSLPSVLESLEKGNGVVDGIPAQSFGDRHVLLVWQYRCILTLRPFPTSTCMKKRCYAPQILWNQNEAGHMTDTKTDPSGLTYAEMPQQ